MTRAERDKGARGEREVAAIFREHGFDCERAGAGAGVLDVRFAPTNTPAHVQSKFQETTRPWAWWAQASAEAGGYMPIVAFRRSRSPWLAIADLHDLVELLARL